MIASRSRTAVGLVPLHRNGHDAVNRDRNVQVVVHPGTGIEVVHSANAFERRLAIALGRENLDTEDLAAVVEWRFVTLTARIAGGRVVGHTVRHGSIDGLRDDTVLKHRLIDDQEVVDDDIGAVRRQISDGVRVSSNAVDAGLKHQIRAWRHVVNDLQHGASFIDAEDHRAAQGRLAVQHRHPARGQVTGQYIRRRATQRVKTVGDHAHCDAGAIYPERRSRDVCAQCDIALTRNGTRMPYGRRRRADRAQARKFQRIFDRGIRQ